MLASLPFLTILFTAVATAGAAQGALLLKDRWQHGREGRFSALHLSLFFEQYAADCSELLSEIQAYNSSGGNAGTNHSGLLPLPKFPEEIEWQRVGIRFTEEAYAFRVARNSAQSMIDYLRWEEPPDGGGFELLLEAAKLGLRALDLAQRIRKDTKLSPAEVPNAEYTVERHLKECRDNFRGIEERRNAERRASLDALNTAAAN